jgi:hypothetical protein
VVLAGVGRSIDLDEALGLVGQHRLAGVALIARLSIDRSFTQERTGQDAAQGRLATSVTPCKDVGLSEPVPATHVLLADLDGGFLAEYVVVAKWTVFGIE